MIGPISNSIAIIIGASIGATCHRHIPTRVSNALPAVSGLIAICLGITLLIKVRQVPAMVLAILIGYTLGELLQLEDRLNHSIKVAQKKLLATLKIEHSKLLGDEKHLGTFVSLLVLFSVSGLGIFGAIQEGLNGDYTLLVTKAILDFFTSIIFATQLGISLALLAIPQFLIQCGLLISSQWLMPLTIPTMLADFSATGGVILLAIGLRITGIKIFAAVNMLPALLLIMPISAILQRL